MADLMEILNIYKPTNIPSSLGPQLEFGPGHGSEAHGLGGQGQVEDVGTV